MNVRVFLLPITPKIEGIVLLDFAVDNATLFQVPFLVTKENLSNPIIGYNTIEHLVL